MHPQTDSLAPEAQIRRTVQEFVEAYNSREVARLPDIFADDFIDMSAGVPTRTGKEAKEHFVSRVEGTHAKFTPHLTVNIEELRVAADWAYQRGSLVVTLVPRNGGETSFIRQRYLEIWRRDADGRWRIAIAMDNSAEA